MHALIIGPRGVGKSTLIRRVLQELNKPVFGFETKKETHLEDAALGCPVYIYDAGTPHIQTADNLVGYCKNRHFTTYAEAFDRYASKLRRPVPAGHIVKLDEIGFMESKSAAFCSAVLSLLDGSTPVIAAVKDKDFPFLEAVRSHPNCRCFYVTEANRDALVPEVLEFMRQQENKPNAVNRMNRIPTIAFAAYSGTGKTTVIEKLVAYLKAQGLRVAVIKHDAHRFEIDKEGKDSWRFTKAGADMTIISSAEKTAIIEQRERSLWQNLEMVHDVDLILVEGYKNENLPQIGISRKATGKGFPADLSRYVAVITDETDLEPSVPQFSLDDTEGLAAFILRNRAAFSASRP